jgi:hypothetical protein
METNKVYIVEDLHGVVAVFSREADALNYADYHDPDESLEYTVEEYPLKGTFGVPV